MRRSYLAVLVTAFLAVACSTTIPTTTVVLDQVGPMVAGPHYAPLGYLRIYTQTQDSLLDSTVYQINTPYWVYDEAGKKVLTVQNQVGGDDTTPMLARLKPGRYRVVARAAGYGLVTLPVLIQGGMLTEAWLQAGGLRDTQHVPKEDLVCLPNGTPVGFRAKGSAAQPAAPAPKPPSGAPAK